MDKTKPHETLSRRSIAMIPKSCRCAIGEAGEDCYPAIRPAMAVLHLDGKRVLAVEVAHKQGQAALRRARLRPLRLAQRKGPGQHLPGSRGVQKTYGFCTPHCSMRASDERAV